MGSTNGVIIHLSDQPTAFQEQTNECSVLSYLGSLTSFIKNTSKYTMNKNQGNADDPLWLNDFEVQQQDCRFQSP